MILASQGKEYPTLAPSAGFAEQSPNIWWKAVSFCIQSVIRKIQQNPAFTECSISSLGLSGQMHGLVALDHKGVPLRNAIVWLDGRSAEICSKMKADGSAEEFHHITGLSVATGYMAPSLAWVRKHEPDIYSQIAHVMLPKDFIRFKLTGTICTERSDASGTYLFDITNSTWSDQIISYFGFRRSIFPDIIPSLMIAGRLTPEASRETGLASGIPVAAGGSDQAMAALSLGLHTPGKVAAGINTGGTVITPSNTPLIDKRLHTFCHAFENSWLLMGATLTAGVALSWFLEEVINKSQIQGEGTVSQIEDLTLWAKKVSPGSDGLIFSPYLSGIRTPHVNANARGSFIGLNLSHSVNHMVRAIMEGVAYSMAESLDIFQDLNLPIRELINYAGGSNSSVWRQILCDVFDLPLSTFSNSENSAAGAAIAGAMAIQDNTDLLLKNQVLKQHHPIRENVQKYSKMRHIYKAIYSNLIDIFDEIKEIQTP